jgi:hypothetical protein
MKHMQFITISAENKYQEVKTLSNSDLLFVIAIPVHQLESLGERRSQAFSPVVPSMK